MYSFRRRKGERGDALMHIYILVNIVILYITTEPLDGCLRNLLWIKKSLIKELPRVDRARNPVGDDKIKTLVT